MERQNITLSVPKDLLRKAKITAAERGTSVTALVIELLREEMELEREYSEAQKRELETMEGGLDYRIPPPGRRWHRSDLHDP